MKFFFKLMAVSAMVLGSVACKSNTDNKETKVDDKKVLVCYFSATGNTAKDAEHLARILNSDLFVIEPEVPYTAEDLDWTNTSSRSYLEMHDPSSRPAIKGVPENIEEYDYIFLGYPNWWDKAPTLINTFIEQASLDGKNVVPFMSSGTDPIDNSADLLKKNYPQINWHKGLRTTGATEKQLSDWARGLVYGS